MKNKPKIVERKLGREQAWGQSFPYATRPKIEIDPRLSARRHLEVMCHEALHIALPHLLDAKGEAEVDRIGKVVSDALWRGSYRRVVLHHPHTTPVRISKSKNKSRNRKRK
jgi:hypothetical protein